VPAQDRAAALGAQLARIHQALRDQLRDVRDRLADDPGRPVGGPPAMDVVHHCLMLCGALRAHHTGEDGDLFPALLRGHPEFAATMDKLREDHRLIADILARLRDLLARAAETPDRGSLVRELDGLAAIMESHFAYEERRIARAAAAL